MKSIFCFILSTIAFLFSCTKEHIKTVNPNATPESRKLLQFLYEIQGNYILSGQHNFIASGSKYTEIIKGFFDYEKVLTKDDVIIDKNGNYRIYRK